MIILKKESCVIGEPGDWLKNQGTCGNCNRLVGSVCGNKTASEKLDDSKQEVVCKDLGCVEKLSGGTEVRRENGESWCDYQSNFGLFPADIPGLGILNYIGGFGGFGFIGVHSVGPPGSQFFKRTCINGEISLETCAPYRNDICAEQREDVNGAGKTVSSATCRANRWAECLKYNPDEKLPGILGQMKVYQAMAKCEVDPDCFVKTVNVGSNFKFPVCVPKYPAGFVFDQGNGGSGDGVCKFASQECVAMFVKEAKAMGLGGAKWECKSNCECVDNKNDPDSA